MRGRQQTALQRELVSPWNFVQDDKLMWLVDWRVYDKPYCSLYVICPDGEWPCKIGISVNPRKRVMSLQTSVWKPLRVAKCYWCPTVAEAKMLERKIHQVLNDDNKWLHGEWFDMRPNDTVELIQFCASVIGVECHDKIEDEEIIKSERELYAYESQMPNNIMRRADNQQKQLMQF